MTAPAPVQIDMADPTNCHIVETERTHLDPREHALLRELLRPGARIEAVIPEDASPDELWRTLDACVRGLSKLEVHITRLKPIIGRILLMFENKPSLYKDLGYETYSEFMEQGVYDKLGLHRTSAYEGKLVARDFPQITPDRYTKIGPKKLNLVSKVVKGDSPNAEMLLATAETMKVGEFRQYMEQRGMIQPGEGNGATLIITCNRSVYKHFKEFTCNRRVHEVVGSKDPSDILEAMLEACEGDWLELAERQRKVEAIR